MDSATFDRFEMLLRWNMIEDATKLAAAAPQNARSRDGRYGILSSLCLHGPDDPDLLRHFMKLGATLELDCSGLRFSVLHLAASRNKPKLIRTLLDLGIPVDIMDNVNSTPLDLVFRCWSLDLRRVCVKILLDAGAKLSLIRHTTVIPPWALAFANARERTRATSIACLGVIKFVPFVGGGSKDVAKRKTLFTRDVMRIIARCIWSTRGHTEWEQK